MSQDTDVDPSEKAKQELAQLRLTARRKRKREFAERQVAVGKCWCGQPRKEGISKIGLPYKTCVRCIERATAAQKRKTLAKRTALSVEVSGGQQQPSTQ